MGLLPAGAVGDPADRGPPHSTSQAGHQEGGTLNSRGPSRHEFGDGSHYVGGDLRDQLAYVGSSVVQAGLVTGSGGNLSARQPGSDELWVTAAGTWLDRLDRGSFAAVRITDGSVVDDDESSTTGRPRPRPTTELALHLAVYRTRPDVNAVIHLHPQAAVLLTAMGEPIRLITTDHAAYVRRVATVPFHPPGSTALADAVAKAVVDGTDCVILNHHGCSALGSTVEWAHRRVSNVDEAARLTYQALLITGGIGPQEIPDCPTW